MRIIGIYPSRDPGGGSYCEAGQVVLFAGSYVPRGWKIAGAKAAEKALHTSANLVDKGDNLRYIESLGMSSVGVDRSLFIGEIRLTTAKTIPTNGYFCEGQLLEFLEEGNLQLFSLIGKVYGGDGRVNFCLPDLSKIQSISKMKYYIVKDGPYPQIQENGSSQSSPYKF